MLYLNGKSNYKHSPASVLVIEINDHLLNYVFNNINCFNIVNISSNLFHNLTAIIP